MTRCTASGTAVRQCQVTKCWRTNGGLIDQDRALAARILKVSNSALYGFQSEIRSLRSCLGIGPFFHLELVQCEQVESQGSGHEEGQMGGRSLEVSRFVHLGD